MGVRELAIFGSVARDEAGDESDVDVLVDYLPGTRLSYFRVFELQERLEEMLGAKVDLVTMGVGEVDPPSSVADRVHDLGFLSDEEAPDAFAAAAAYVQPSRNESFSRTVMEAWMAGTPVLANAESAVVAWHCERSGAGITWTGADELSAAIEAVAASLAAFEALAIPGRDYVLEHYTWPTVLDRMEQSLEEMPWS